jgi:hypothetical protein
MLLPLALLLTAASFSPASPAQDPVIGIDLNSDGCYVTGDRAQVKVKTAADGYLVVLRRRQRLAKGDVHGGSWNDNSSTAVEMRPPGRPRVVPDRPTGGLRDHPRRALGRVAH